ncbi:Phosphotransferase system cellobiose-specific component IIA [Streptococcus suis 05ZYH33]|nr:Phosphotransferase system cellobiose-specific component IIA [Streptococcus suis 05ZYH33]
MNSPEYLEAIMGLIMYGGEAKGFASQAIQAAKEGRIDEAEQLLQDAIASLNIAHKSQTQLLAKEASGESVGIIFVNGTWTRSLDECFDIY